MTKSVIIRANDSSAIRLACRWLARGHLVIAPSETCYGILADATQTDAIRKVFRAKHRSSEKKVSVFVSGYAMATHYAIISSRVRHLMKQFLPGPLTIVLTPKTSHALSPAYFKDSVAIRVSSHPFISKLVKQYGKPLTATSANVSGGNEIYSFKEIFQTFSHEMVLLVNGGTLRKQAPSTVLDVTQTPYRVLRKGAIDVRY
ncbi:threonylcarbamoyl-AMP synthase [Candidatus Micrarchaeota archaeon]|nr:threonylcarbamoyl-AMP synthase [Candidatus Micrarchaeota archaeon]